MSEQQDGGMDLETFVETTIVQVMRGVKKAMDAAQEIDSRAHVNPVVSHSYHSEPKEISFGSL